MTISDKSIEAPVDEEVDVFAAYRREGRNWTHEMAGGMTFKSTVKNVTEDGCDLEFQMFDKGIALGEASTGKINFKIPEPPGDDLPNVPAPKEKTIKCKAGEFDCISYDGGKMWLMKKYPGIVVKTETMELIEFNE